MVHAIIVAVAIIVGVGSRWYFQKDSCMEDVAEAVIQAECGVEVDFGGKQPFKKVVKTTTDVNKTST